MHLKTGLLLCMLLLGSFSAIGFGAGCNQACGSHLDCDQESCRECREVVAGVFRCRSCCDNIDEVDCQSPCVWNGVDQCQNVSGVDCYGIPEVPSQRKFWALFAILAIVFSGVGLFQLSKRRASKRE